MFLDAFSENPYGTNCWLVAADDSEDVVVIDPGFYADQIHELVREAGKRPVAAIATHGHADHVGAAADFCRDELPFHIHEADRAALTDPVGWGAGIQTQPIPVADIRTMKDGDVLEYAGFSIEVVHTPGHTPGSVCFLTDGSVFSGDLVFAGSIGRSDFPNSDGQAMAQSLKRFLEWDDAMPVLPGHGPRTTVGTERATNPFLLDL